MASTSGNGGCEVGKDGRRTSGSSSPSPLPSPVSQKATTAVRSVHDAVAAGALADDSRRWVLGHGLPPRIGGGDPISQVTSAATEVEIEAIAANQEAQKKLRSKQVLKGEESDDERERAGASVTPRSGPRSERAGAPFLAKRLRSSFWLIVSIRYRHHRP